MEMTLGFIKPDATERNISGKILSYIENTGLEIIALKMVKLSKQDAENFYAVHKERPFYVDLVNFISSGKIVVYVLKGDNAVLRYREIMGATNPENANIGTIRKDFAISLDKNSIHGSDSVDNALNEINFFFSQREIY